MRRCCCTECLCPNDVEKGNTTFEKIIVHLLGEEILDNNLYKFSEMKLKSKDTGVCIECLSGRHKEDSLYKQD